MFGCPSAELAVSMADKEKQRIKQQRQKLGDNGLKEKGEALKQAIALNEVYTCVFDQLVDCSMNNIVYLITCFLLLLDTTSTQSRW